MEKAKQTSDSIELGYILALSGGLMDAYSYIYRGHVFANAQTGNILLLGVFLAEGKYLNALQYFFPICAFAIGITITDLIHLKKTKVFHWRQVCVLIEAIILALVSFMSKDLDLIANSLTSLACGIQVESFRKIHGHTTATTMCIGNLRSGTENMNLFFATHKRHYLTKSILYYSIILCFVIGAIIGNITIQHFQEKAILCSTFLLFIAFLFMFIDREKIYEKE